MFLGHYLKFVVPQKTLTARCKRVNAFAPSTGGRRVSTNLVVYIGQRSTRSS